MDTFLVGFLMDPELIYTFLVGTIAIFFRKIIK